MNLTELKIARLKVLNDAVKYYSTDPQARRNVRTATANYYGVESLCVYSPETSGKTTSEGCAVGRLIPTELATRLDQTYTGDSTVTKIFDELPEDLKDLGLDFLADLQGLHDTEIYWDFENKDISEKGILKVKELTNKIETGEYEN